jgi:uncharacterized membrane protein YbhN (UPF0104 family)
VIQSRLVKVGQLLFVVVVVAVFAKVASDNASQLREVHLTVRPWRLLLALPAALVVAPLLPLAWRQVLAATGHPIGRRDAVRTWYLGQTARYLPTGLLAFASRAVLVARFGVPQAVTVATVVVEMGTIVVVGGGLAAAALPSSELAVGLRVLIAAGALVGLAVGPLVLRAVSGRVPRLAAVGTSRWDRGRLYEAELLFVANGVAKSLVFVLFASAIQPIHGGDVLLLVGAFHAATTFGTIGITPAGLGVREGALAAILTDRLGLGDATALAVAARVWDTAIEVVWLAVVQATRPRAGEPLEAPATEPDP